MKDSAILPPRRGPRIYWPGWVGWLVVALVIAINFIPPSEGHRSQCAGCLSNLSQLGLGAMMYAEDNNDRFSQRDWMDAVYPFTKNDQIEHCTSFPPNGNKYGYSMWTKSLGVSMTNGTSRDPLFFDSTDLGRNSVGELSLLPSPPRQDGANNVVFRDGHAARQPMLGGEK